MAVKICFVLSSVGGSGMLSPLFSGRIPPEAGDVAYVVIQRMAADNLLEVLVECLREELNRKVTIAGRSTPLEPGAIHFLSNERNYAFAGDRLDAVQLPDQPGLSLDRLFLGAAEAGRVCAVVVLSGLLADEDGLDGLSRLHAMGAPILGTVESQTPVFGMIEELSRRELMGKLFPPRHLLEHLRFSDGGRDEPRKIPRFLVADDDESMRVLLSDLLESEGAVCDVAMDGLEALRKIQKGKYDAILLDLQMPEIDGVKTLEALKSVDPNLPVVILTGMDNPGEFITDRQPNLLAVMQKPFQWEKLKKILPGLKRDG